MLTLVKTMKTMCLSNRMDWKRVNKRVMGIHFINDVTAAMVLKTPGYGETRLLSTNNSNKVAFMTLHEPDMSERSLEEEVEHKVLDKILESSGINTDLHREISVSKTLYNYVVFRLENEREINNVVLEYRLRSRGIKTMMDFDIHGALVVQMEDIVWHFFNSGKVFAIVGGYDAKDAMRIAEGSWEEIKSYT